MTALPKQFYCLFYLEMRDGLAMLTRLLAWLKIYHDAQQERGFSVTIKTSFCFDALLRQVYLPKRVEKALEAFDIQQFLFFTLMDDRVGTLRTLLIPNAVELAGMLQ